MVDLDKPIEWCTYGTYYPAVVVDKNIRGSANAVLIKVIYPSYDRYVDTILESPCLRNRVDEITLYLNVFRTFKDSKQRVTAYGYSSEESAILNGADYNPIIKARKIVLEV